MGCHDILQVIRNISSVTVCQLKKKPGYYICQCHIFLKYLPLVCSSEDFEVMDQIFCIREHNGHEESFFERGYDYRLNIHTRDFELGRTIDSNIEEAITCSRRLIVLLSR